MSHKTRIVLAQLNLIVGDIQGNLKKHLDAATHARDHLSADIIIFSELSLTGYAPEDLLLRKQFIVDTQLAFKRMVSQMKGIYCLVGHPHADNHHLYNSCSLIYDGKVVNQYHKQRLPNYGVFDESRYFTPGQPAFVVPIRGIPTSFLICEDLWKLEPTRDAAAHGARLILAPNASPFESDKHEQRLSVLAKRARHDQLSIAYVNQVGGQDELVFDGGSMVVNAEGKMCQFAGFFNETLFPVDIDTQGSPLINTVTVASQEQRIYQALVLSVRDYVEKNRFPSVIVGVSGGIDSALTLAIAVDALGKERVKAVFMPSRFTAAISFEDAKELCANLGVNMDTISIEPTYESFLKSLSPHFADKKSDITEENIQARCRAIILMALSNKFGHLVLTTGNRSEMAVGYCTLYGDMAGGFAVLKDIPKTLVYKLVVHRNKLQAAIPQRTLERPPTAELAPNQKDEDSLPPYTVLDQILYLYLNQSQSIEDIIAQGFEAEVVKRVISLIHRNEYKRRQAAIGPHINHKSFGRDWRYPITSGFKG
jgi:NAD+ synthase (glutamine-hydrolysing)